MQRSIERILTTHVGSLPRSGVLADLLVQISRTGFPPRPAPSPFAPIS
jgi:hypothetical protein